MTSDGKPFVVPQSVYDKVDDEAKKQIDENGTVVSDVEFAEMQTPTEDTTN